jgi:hypothetical protein
VCHPEPMRDAPYPSFVAFAEGVALPRLPEFADRKRSDEWSKGGYWEEAGRFQHKGNLLSAVA